MAVNAFILRDASVTVAGTDLSDHVDTVEIAYTYDVVDVSAMGNTQKAKLLGLGDGTITVNFFQDFASSKVDATLYPLLGSNTPFTIVVKPTSATVSATNPSYTMIALLPTYQPLSGKVGAASMANVTFENGDQTGIVRATS
jgi:hypothetical protein